MLQIVLISALLILVFMTAVWLFSIYRNDMSIVDGFWGLGFMAVAHHWFFRLDNITALQFVITYLVTLWGLRLAAHIFFRNAGKGEDPRYMAFRSNWGKNTWWISYFKVFLLQGVLMLVISLPIISIMHSDVEQLSLINQIGIGIWLFGWLFESIADYQLLIFKRNPANKGKVMDTGLWRYSRHPNYFGETCVWWGIFLIAACTQYWFLALLSPLLISYLLLKVSGVTMLEKRYDGNDKYAEYKRRTSSFIPLPRKK